MTGQNRSVLPFYALVMALQKSSYNPGKIILLDNNESGLHDLTLEVTTLMPDTPVIPVLVDITIRKSVERVLEQYKVQVIFHTAAYKHVPMLEHFPNEAVRVNIQGTRNLAELARDYNVERFVLISTDKAVEPTSVMGASKRVCELLIKALSNDETSSTLFTVVRFGNVLGSRGSVLPIFERQIAKGGPVTVTHPEMTRYFLSIPEAVNLVIHAACLTNGGEIFLLKMGQVVRITKLAERMIRLRGLVPNEDIEITFTGIRPGEKLHEELYTDTQQPTQTVHPGIIKLIDDNHIVTMSFMEDLDELLSNGLDPNQNALSQLVKISTMESKMAVS